MKGFIGFLAVVGLVAGIILWMYAQSVISSYTYYTWTAPYTSFEAKYIMMRVWGIILTICGALMGILVIVSHAFTARVVQEVSAPSATAVKCPNCGLSVTADTHTCPNCKTKIQ